MREIPVTQFKATCLAVMENVRKTRRPVRVTRYGKPIAEIVPPAVKPKRKKSGLGSMAGTIEFLGDIVGPIGALEDGWTGDRMLENRDPPAEWGARPKKRA